MRRWATLPDGAPRSRGWGEPRSGRRVSRAPGAGSGAGGFGQGADLVGGGGVGDDGAGVDAADQALQDFARAELDVAGGAELAEAFDAAGPVDWAGELAGEEAAGLAAASDDPRLGVGDQGDLEAAEVDAVEGLAEGALGGAHQGGVEAAADGEGQDPLGPGVQGAPGGLLDGRGLAGDDHLAGGVGVGQEHLANLAADGPAELADGLVGEAEDDPHDPGAAGVVGELGPADDQLQALLEADPAGREQGGVLAEGVAGDQVGAQALLAGQQVAGGRVDVDGRLGLAGVGQGGVAGLQDLDHVPAEDLRGPDERPAGRVAGPRGGAARRDAALAREGEGGLVHGQQS